MKPLTFQNNIKKILFLVLFSLISFANYAQKATFLVLDAEDFAPIPQALVHSRIDAGGKQHTEKNGTVTVFLAKNDEILIEHVGFYPLRLVIKQHKEFDYSQTIIVHLTPLAPHHKNEKEFTDKKRRKDIKSEFDFTHPKTNLDSGLEIHVFEHYGAKEKRAAWTQTQQEKYKGNFNILKLNIDK